MTAKTLGRLGLVALPLMVAGAAHAFEASTPTSIWDRFTLDQGATAGISLRGFRLPQFAPTLTPMVGLNYENAQAASAVRGAWLTAARVGSFSAGPLIAIDRQLSLSSRPLASDLIDQRAARYGAFLAYTDSGVEIGRLALTTGRLGGLDLKATRSFKLNDNVSLDIGPTISLGSFERFGYEQASRSVSVASGGASLNPDRAQLGAFGLATAIETRISDRTVARMFADYARVEAQRGQPGMGQIQNRDRVDLGFSLTTRIGN